MMNLTVSIKYRITLRALLCAVTHVIDDPDKRLTRKAVWGEMRDNFFLYGVEDLHPDKVDEVNRWWFKDQHYDEAVAWIKTLPLTIPKKAWDELEKIRYHYSRYGDDNYEGW